MIILRIITNILQLIKYQWSLPEEVLTPDTLCIPNAWSLHERKINQNVLHITFETTARTSQMWLLYAFSYRKSCDIREAKFSRRPVKDDYPDSPLIWSSPFLTSLLLKLASGVFFPPDMNFASMDKMELNENLWMTKIMRHVRRITYLQRCLMHSKH